LLPVSAVLPRGLGRAYGDAAVPASPDTCVVATPGVDRILRWDPASGRLTCEAGLALGEVLRLFLPRGWGPPVAPGTTFGAGGCGRPRQEPSPRRLLRPLRGRTATARGRRVRGQLRPRRRARPLPRDRGRDGPHRAHHRGDVSAAPGGGSVDDSRVRRSPSPRRDARRAAFGAARLSLHGAR